MSEQEEGCQPEPKLSFGESLKAIERIVERIEAEDIDIDQLAEELRKAAELLEVCRGKIRKAELEVRHIVDRLDEDEAPPST